MKVRQVFQHREWSPTGAVYAPVWTLRPWAADAIPIVIRVAAALLILIAVS